MRGGAGRRKVRDIIASTNVFSSRHLTEFSEQKAAVESCGPGEAPDGMHAKYRLRLVCRISGPCRTRVVVQIDPINSYVARKLSHPRRPMILRGISKGGRLQILDGF